MSGAALDMRTAPATAMGPVQVAGYALGSLGTGVFSTVPALLLLFYCTETLKIPAGLAAIVVFIPKVWCIVWDPAVGLWSDRTTSRFGRRTPFLVLGGLGIFATFLAVFHTPVLPPTLAFGWVLVSYFLLATLYSLFAVPYVALPSELGTTPSLRSALVSTRMMTASVGNLAGASFAPLLVQHFGSGRSGYAGMSWVLASVCLMAMAGPVLVMRGRERPGSRARTGGVLAQLTVAARSREFRLLGASYLLQIGATGAFLAIIPYMVTRVAGQPEGQAGVALGIMLMVATIASPIWGWLGRRFGDATANVWALVLYAAAIAALGLAAFAQRPWPELLAMFGVAGVFFSATQVLPFVRQAHIAHAAAADGAVASEGAFAGTWTAVEKLGLATGPAIAAVALSAIGSNLRGGVPLYLATVAPAMLLVSILPLLRIDRANPAASSRERAALP